MRKRTQAREFALQVLYKMDICRELSDAALDSFWNDPPDENIEEEVKKFTSELVRGVEANSGEIDKEIIQYAENWQLERMSYVDRNILRLSSYELIFREDIPPKVSINEAVELAKRYSGDDAGKFVNAILDKIKIEIGKE